MSEIDDSFSEAFDDLASLDLAISFTYSSPTVTFTAVPAYRDPGKRDFEIRSSDNEAIDVEALFGDLTAGIPAVGTYVDEVATGKRRKVEKAERPPNDPLVLLRLGRAFTPTA